MNIQRSFLESSGWLWTAILGTVAVVAAYVAYSPIGGRDGSSILGYGLGGLSAVLVVYLSILGIRKRRFASSAGRRRDAVSAHVYLGLLLIVTATLHSGFEFEWSLHTLVYVLLMVVVLSGIWGIVAYARLPDRIARNLSEQVAEKKRFDASNLEQLEEDLGEIDARLNRSLQFLPDAFRDPIRRSLERTRIGGGLFSILSGSSANCDTARALDDVRRLVDEGSYADEERRRLTDVVRDLARKREVAACLRRDARFRGLMQIWLWLHVPVTMALIMALIGHVVVVFFYW